MTENKTTNSPNLSDAPWLVAEARVSIADPRYTGFRIVGYRVPAEHPEMIQSLFDLSARDAAYVRTGRLLVETTEALRDLAGELIDLMPPDTQRQIADIQARLLKAVEGFAKQ